ncbi:MAG: DUF4893 domain-containing protein [Hyphomicrobiaceae bacterium]|nr:DUF4893 domain-containing protein [Hyphomicrobiaceae bacterium]
MRNKFAAAALALVIGLSGHAGLAAPFACDATALVDATADDVSRMDNFFTSRTRGLAAALAAESNADQQAVSTLFESGLAPVDETLLSGDYQCRTIKMGGISPLVVYSWFRCEIRPEGDVFTIRKTTGSQNFFGTLRKQNDLFTYQGASSYGYENGVRLYGEDEERNQVGCLSAVTKGNRHFILELPFPKFESYHDVIELKPVN